MKVALISMGAENIGVEYLSSVLKKAGHKVFLIFDPALFTSEIFFEEKNNNLVSKIFNYKNMLLREIKLLNPDLIGFSVLTPDYQWALDIAKDIKESFDIPIVFGGLHPTMVPEIVIKNDCVDMVVVGEGEYALLDLVNNFERGKKKYHIDNVWFKDNDRIIQNRLRPLIQNLDLLPFPDKELFYQKVAPFQYEYTIQASRGCPFNCSYCENNFFRKIYSFETKLRRVRSVDSIIIELKQNRYDMRLVIFEDVLFPYEQWWLEEFTEKYSKEIKLPFVCSSHPNMITENRVKLLKKAGCYLVYFGIQTAIEYIRKGMLNRYETNGQIKEAARLLHKFRINFFIDHILGIPSDAEKGQILAVKLYNQIRPSKICVYWLTYFPKTDITQIAQRLGILSEKDIKDIEEGGWLSQHCGGSVSEETKKMLCKFETIFSLIPLLPQRVIKFILKNKLYKRMPYSFFLIQVLMVLTMLKMRYARSWFYVKTFFYSFWRYYILRK